MRRVATCTAHVNPIRLYTNAMETYIELQARAFRLLLLQQSGQQVYACGPMPIEYYNRDHEHRSSMIREYREKIRYYESIGVTRND